MKGLNTEAFNIFIIVSPFPSTGDVDLAFNPIITPQWLYLRWWWNGKSYTTASFSQLSASFYQILALIYANKTILLCKVALKLIMFSYRIMFIGTWQLITIYGYTSKILIYSKSFHRSHSLISIFMTFSRVQINLKNPAIIFSTPP